MNPLKMKTSFLRQSLTLNTSEQYSTLNLHNPLNIQRDNTLVGSGLVLQPERK